jgi:hypothetical protein
LALKVFILIPVKRHYYALASSTKGANTNG